MPQTEEFLRLVPSRVEGMPEVTEVLITPHELKLCSSGHWHTLPFASMATWHRHGGFYRLLMKLGLGLYGHPLVADRDWFCPPSERFFRFYTEPPIAVYMPHDEPEEPGDTTFERIKGVLAKGGFYTSDLG